MSVYTVNIRLKIIAHNANHASDIANVLADAAKEPILDGVPQVAGASVESVDIPIKVNS